MGVIKKGANGGFSGKAGSVVGSSWNGVDYIKGLPKISHKSASLGQIEQRLRFATATRFLGPLAEVLVRGWKGQTSGRNTPVNVAVKYALANALTGVYPDFEMDPSLVLISQGNLGNLLNLAVQADETGGLSLTWDFIEGDGARKMDDEVWVVVYNPIQETFLTYSAKAIRSALELTLALPANFTGQEIHVYVFCIKSDDKKRSRSVYTGPLTVA